MKDLALLGFFDELWTRMLLCDPRAEMSLSVTSCPSNLSTVDY